MVVDSSMGSVVEFDSEYCASWLDEKIRVVFGIFVLFLLLALTTALRLGLLRVGRPRIARFGSFVKVRAGIDEIFLLAFHDRSLVGGTG